MLSKKSGILIVSLMLSLEIFSQEIIKILPLGNSITYDQRNIDNRSTGDKISYRYKLYNLLTQAGYNFDFIGSYRSGYNYFDDCDNSGFKGIDTKNLSDLVATGTSEFTGKITTGPYLNSYTADIILLEIGTNDMTMSKYSVTEINNLLNAVDLYEQQSGNPVLVIIGTIISIQNYPCGTYAKVNQFNNNLKSMVQNRINNGDKLILVDMECGTGINYYNDMWDELHPNPTGYDKMGQKWFNTIDAINARPVVYDIPNQKVTEGSNFATINLNNYVSDIDDPDASIIWTTATEPQHLTITINSTRIATIVPKDPEWNGSETVTFIARDPGKYIPKLHGSDQDNVTFEVTPVNDPPAIISQLNDVSINENEQYEIVLNDLDISDPDDPAGSHTIIVLPGSNYQYSGTLITPSDNFSGQLIVNIKVSDGEDLSDLFQFVIDVISVNHPPVITSVPITDADDYVKYIYRLTAHDPDNQEVIYAQVKIPGWAEFDAGTGILTGTPKYNDIGDFEVILKASDGEKETFQTFTIHVSDINDKPQFITIPDTVIGVRSQYYYAFEAVDMDEDDILEYSIIEKPAWLTYNGTQNSLTGMPDTSDVGKTRVVLNVTDGKESTEQIYDLNVRLYTGSDNIKAIPMSVYPVPATDYIYISCSAARLIKSDLYDLNGKLIRSEAAVENSGILNIQVSDINHGTYILKVYTDRGDISKTILIE